MCGKDPFRTSKGSIPKLGRLVVLYLILDFTYKVGGTVEHIALPSHDQVINDMKVKYIAPSLDVDPQPGLSS